MRFHPIILTRETDGNSSVESSGSEMMAIFFDFARPQREPDLSAGSTRSSYYAALLPRVLQMLARWPSEDLKLGLIAETREGETGKDLERTLRKAGIHGYFQQELLICTSVVGHQKDSLEIFKIAVVSAGLSATPRHCLFVGDDLIEQIRALEAGMQACSLSEFFRLVGSGDFDL
jgi:FMN phosphatase YigB (HAD superfamily)